MDAAGAACSRHPSPVTLTAPKQSEGGRHPLAFTLIELLAVIAIIGVLAALMFPVLGAIKRQQYIRNAQAEMAQLEAAINSYHDAYGFYPPDNQLTPGNPLMNQLYFELLGTTNTAGNAPAAVYQSLDDPSLPPLSQVNVSAVFGVSGFMNCSKLGSGEDAPKARNFLPGLKPNQMVVYTNSASPVNPIKLIVTSVGGPDAAYQPLGAGAVGINPWRYNSSNPANNPGAYDLWVQLSISGKTNLVCNWNRQVQLNSPLP
jgi:prepilin-type N-terminal cleavage/methylation domain-containing protein